MEKSKAVLIATTVLIAMGATVGCGNASGGGKSNGKITLTISEWTNPPAIAATKKLDKEFEKAHPNVTINLVDAPTSGSAWTTLTNTEMKAHNVDVMAQYSISGQVPQSYMTGLQPSTLEEWIDAGDIKDLTNEPFMKKDFLPGIQQQMMGYKGKIWGATMASYGRGGVFYNEALFKKYNLSIPTTYSQLLNVCKVFAAHGITPLMVGAKDGWDQMITEDAIQQMIPHSDADALNKSLWTGKTTWSSDPVFKTAMTEYQQLSQYFEPNAFGEPYAPTPGLFANGKAAMLVDGTWDGLSIEQANPKLKFSWFPLPMTQDPAKNQMQVAGDFTWVIPTKAPHAALALDYVKFFSEPAHYKQWENMVGAIPTEKMSTVNLPWMKTELQYSPKSEQEFHIFQPTAATGSLLYFPNDTAYLKPQGQYSLADLLSKSTQEWLAAVHH
ncbi:ABC transporter substrate-binding protein [Alicyclobacillus fodiniaquatilis]|uniref:ABC transporter substrate-binding protein n=1 Tax=Alicyclobacillus fodiniaquatilis TaxID=1661150 RepID=A0ABW4JC18_9BACL